MAKQKNLNLIAKLVSRDVLVALAPTGHHAAALEPEIEAKQPLKNMLSTAANATSRSLNDARSSLIHRSALSALTGTLSLLNTFTC